MSSRPATPLTVFGGASSPKPEAPRCSERIPVIAGHSGIGIGSRRPNEDHAVLSITVSADQVLRVRKAVVALAHPAIDLLSVTPLPGGPRVRLTAHLASEVVDVLTKRILEFVVDRNPGAICACDLQPADDVAR